MEQGNAEAQFNLGVMYDNGEGVPQDDAEDVKWYRMAAQQGNARAQCNLGVKYDTGKGVPQDDAEAVKWFLKAAQQGNATAVNNLIAMGNRGNSIAQFNMGEICRDGLGVPQDNAEAAKWYRRRPSKDSHRHSTIWE